MRQLIFKAPAGSGPQIAAAARAHEARGVAIIGAASRDGPLDMVMCEVSNAHVEPLIGALGDLPGLHVTLVPRGVIALEPPPEEAPDQVTDVEARSPLEVFLGGLQSVGSWKGFLAYAFVAGVVVWIGLFTNTVYLLTAAMLIAPFAGPAMNAALATARGDAMLLARSVARYAAALAVAIAVAFLLSLIMAQDTATQQMIDTSQISAVAALLPLVAGAAGALNLCQSERSSLVSGAATGMLVAASLAPPAGMVGMAAALSDWELVGAGAFLLVLQLVGINVSGAVVFRLYGLSPHGARFARGRAGVTYAAWGATALALAAMVAFQLSDSPGLQRSTRQQRAEAAVQDLVGRSGIARLVEVEARFTRADDIRNPLLVELFVESRGPAGDEVRKRLTAETKARLAHEFDATPFVEVTVVGE